MHELPGDVFVTSQLLSAQMEALAEQGIMGFINNRPDMEAPVQPLSEDLETAMQNISIDYHHIPMSGGLTPGLIDGLLRMSKILAPRASSRHLRIAPTR